MTQQKNDVKEIDLLELFGIIGNAIKNFFLAILRLIVFLIVFGIKRTHWIVLAVIVGGLTGYFISTKTPKFYSSDMIAEANGISSRDLVEYINDLNRFTKNKNSTALAKALELSDSLGKKIRSIEAFNYIDVNRDGVGDYVDFNNKFNAKDTNNKIDSRRIYLQVKVLDNLFFPVIKQGIINYIHKNPYLIQLNQIRKNELKELIVSTQAEITKLDSLQNIDYFDKEIRNRTLSQADVLFLSEKDKQLYYKDIIELTMQKQAYEKELELSSSPLTIIKDFTQLTVEENPNGVYIFRFGIWFGVCCYLFILVLKYKNQIYKILP